jgi:hypothetical protein
MKTKIKMLIMLGILFFALTNCSKKDFDQQSNNPLKSGHIIYGLDVNLDANTQTLSSLISNTADTSERRMNYYYYYLAVSLEELVENQSFNEYVIGLAQQSPNNVAYFTTIYNGSLAYKNIIDDVLDGFNITFDEIADHYTYNHGSTHEVYMPAIFVPNADTANVEKQPIFSPNIELDCSSDQDLEDCIVVWYFDHGQKVEAILNEAKSLITSNPIFLLDNAEPPASKKMQALPPEGGLKSTETTTIYKSYEYRVNQLYEPWPGRCEFTIVAYRIDSQGGTHWIYNAGGWMQIDKIQRSQVNTDLTKWVLHSYNYTPYNSEYVYWNTFERDWMRSMKPLGSATENGTTIYLKGNMHHYEDWYAFDPGNLQDHNTDFSYIYSNWSKMYENNKGKYKIWRVEQ